MADIIQGVGGEMSEIIILKIDSQKTGETSCFIEDLQSGGLFWTKAI